MMKKIKFLAILMLAVCLVLISLTSCDAVENIMGMIPGMGGNDKHEHNFSDATCTTPATCECGVTEGEALGHSYESALTAPTCAAAGYTTYTCSVCNDSYKADETAALGHSYESAVTAPTCVAAGYTTYTCSVCNDSYKADETAALGHSYESVVTAPTCGVAGYTTYTCSVCNDSYKADETAALEHSYESAVTAPTCVSVGYTTYTCSVCNDSYTADETAKVAHELDSTGVCPKCNGELAVQNPVVGNGYLFGMTQKKVQNKVYYLKGGMSGYYMSTTVNPAEALLVYIEETEGGFYAYCFVNEVKTYINMVVSGTHVNGEYASAASTVYTVDETNHTIIAQVNGEDYWFGTRNDNTYTTVGPCKTSYNGFFCEFYDVHTHELVQGEKVDPDCENEGYTPYTCACGFVEKKDVEPSLGHIEGEWETASEATCTAEGQKVTKCQREGCGAVVSTETIGMIDHVYVDGLCSCGKEDPSIHKHSYSEVVTAPTCTVKGYTTFTCACGDTYTGAETEIVDHVDTNLDITCDFEGCTKRILPPADSKVSLFTANHMIIVSLSSNYYVEGVITEITDAKNGVFIIEDEEGYSILVRLPKNADGVAYSSWTDLKVTVGDTVQVYGKPAKNSSSPTTEKAKVEGGILTVLKHEHSFSSATCTEDGVCGCLAVGTPALGHIDENGDNVCDRCPWKMNQVLTSIAIATDTNLANGVVDENKTFWTWSAEGFNAKIAKGTSTVTLYTTAKAYMQLKKQNTFTVENLNDALISSITIYASNATQLTNLKNAIGTQYEYTEDAEKLCVTIEYNSTEDFTFSNVSTSTAYISGVDIVWEK